MFPKLTRWAALLPLLLACTARAAVYDYTADPESGRALRLHVSDRLERVRGVLFWGNGAGGDSRGSASDPELQALAEAHGFCLVATAKWTNLGDPREYALLQASLVRLARLSGHAEIVHGIWAPLGHSNGGQMSYALANLAPSRVVGFAASKGGFYNVARPGRSALATPGLLVAGERDADFRVNAIRDLFQGNRPRGARWAWVQEEGRGHEQGDSPELIRPFIDELLRVRYPSSADNPTGLPRLLPVAENTGWLVEPDSPRTGWAEIFRYPEYPGDRRQAGWLPSRRMAFIFRAFASYHKATDQAVLDAPDSRVVAAGTRLTYRIGAPAGDWIAIEFYEGADLLASRTKEEAGPLAVSASVTTPGYAVFHAVVRYADGSRRTTMPRRVFVTAAARTPVSPK